ncbi:MAG: DUF4405 domain-containing protein [Gordonibacter sp.]
MKPMHKNLVIDGVVLIIYLVVANPAITGIGLHEWLGLGIVVVFFIHCLVHYDWIIDVLKGIAISPSLARQGNLLLDLVTFVMFVVVTVSGIGISSAVLQAFGLYAGGYYFWDPLHSISAKVLLALLLVHVVVHWKWFLSFFKQEKGDKHE